MSFNLPQVSLLKINLLERQIKFYLKWGQNMQNERIKKFWLIKFRGRDPLGQPCTDYEDNSQFWRNGAKM
jgi:hypothetical protein